MNRALWRKTWDEAKWLLLFCALGLFLFSWIRVWLVGHIEMSKFATIVGELWGDIGKLSSVPLSHVLTYEGRVAVMFNEPMVVLLITIWSVARGSDVVSGELGRGTMEMLLAQPLSRLQVLWAQAVVGVVGVALLCSATLAGTAFGVSVVKIKETPPAEVRIPGLGINVPLPWQAEREPIYTPMSEKVDARVLLPAAVNLLCLGLFLFSFATLLSAFDRYRWRTIGIFTSVWVVMMVLKAVGMAVEDWAWLQRFSFFTPYAPEWSVYAGMHPPDGTFRLMIENHADQHVSSPLANNLILVGLAALSLLSAAVVFVRRDLPAPL